MSILKRLLATGEARLSQPSVNWLKTLYFNFKMLSLPIALKLPIYIYGKTKLFMLNGRVQVDSPDIRRGMIKIGINSESFSLEDGSGFVSLADFNAQLIFLGPCTIGVNSKIRIVDGVLTLEKNVFMGSSVRIVCNGSSIRIGEGSRIAYETNIMNSNFHYVLNQSKGTVTRFSRAISIGAFNWIGNRSSIGAGVKTKDFTIIAALSHVNKDFSLEETNFNMLAGNPAKIISSGRRRIFDRELEQKLSNWFKMNSDKDVCFVEQDLNIKNIRL